MEKFQREPATVELIDELIPTFIDHEREVGHYHDIPLSPDYAKYLSIEEAGGLRLFTARDMKTEKILGYSIFFVAPALHKRDSLQAEENALYIDPEARGFGGRFIDWTESMLKEDGVQVVIRNVKARPELNFSPILERKGYRLGELVWFKRLDGGAA